MSGWGHRRWEVAAAALAVGLVSTPAEAVDVPNVGGETLTLDISNTSELGYRFDNRNDTSEGLALLPEQHVDDNYGEWLNRLYVRAYYWKLSFGLRLDSAVYFHTLDRESTRELIIEERQERGVDPNVNLLQTENDFARNLHSRYTSLIYPSKLWLGFKNKGVELTVGDFYQQLGRGMVFSVRKLDEVGIDTTVRGGKIDLSKSFDDVRVATTLFGGQLNPIRIDYPTGRILHGSGSPLFFAFPRAGDFTYYQETAPDRFQLATELAKPSYLEDNVVGANFTVSPKHVQIEGNTAWLFRQSNSEEQARCLAAIDPGAEGAVAATDLCLARFPSFSEQNESRSRDRIGNFGGAIRVPPVADTVDAYVEVVGQQQSEGRVTGFAADGSPERLPDIWGWGIYANVNIRGGIFAATLEGKHYKNFFPLGANIDLTTLGFGAPEFNTITYSQPPTAESIFVQTIGARDVCVSGGKGRLDANIGPHLKIYGWVARWISWSEINANLERKDLNDPNSSLTCTPEGDDPNLPGVSRSDVRRTDTWDFASGGEIDTDSGKSHYWAWIGARLTDRAVPQQVNSEVPGDSTAFYREGYIRYDMNQHLVGNFSLSLLGNYRRRYEPDQQSQVWHTGENLLSLNYNPHFSFIFGYEFTTRPGLPTHYFNGAIQYRSKDNETWYGRLMDSVRLFVGQRRAALRCVAGVCRIFPAYEGARFELVSRF